MWGLNGNRETIRFSLLPESQTVKSLSLSLHPEPNSSPAQHSLSDRSPSRTVLTLRKLLTKMTYAQNLWGVACFSEWYVWESECPVSLRNSFIHSFSWHDSIVDSLGSQVWMNHRILCWESLQFCRKNKIILPILFWQGRCPLGSGSSNGVRAVWVIYGTILWNLILPFVHGQVAPLPSQFSEVVICSVPLGLFMHFLATLSDDRDILGPSLCQRTPMNL